MSLGGGTGGGGLSAFYGYQILAIDSVVVKVEKMLSSQFCNINSQT